MNGRKPWLLVSHSPSSRSQRLRFKVFKRLHPLCSVWFSQQHALAPGSFHPGPLPRPNLFLCGTRLKNGRGIWVSLNFFQVGGALGLEVPTAQKSQSLTWGGARQGWAIQKATWLPLSFHQARPSGLPVTLTHLTSLVMDSQPRTRGTGSRARAWGQADPDPPRLCLPVSFRLPSTSCLPLRTVNLCETSLSSSSSSSSVLYYGQQHLSSGGRKYMFEF